MAFLSLLALKGSRPRREVPGTRSVTPSEERSVLVHDLGWPVVGPGGQGRGGEGRGGERTKSLTFRLSFDILLTCWLFLTDPYHSGALV